MCNILILKPGQMISQEDFWNMCYNNWHSYGLVTRVDGKLDIKKRVPESGEIDPQEVWDLCKKDIQYERILHVRHMTAGNNTIENCHPFDIYYDQKSGKQIVFMHNGTLYQYRSKKMTEGNSWVDDDSGPSDTQNFATQVLQPLVAGSDFGTGKGDINNPFFRKIVREFWPGTSNRGILISNDQVPFVFGDWKKCKAEDGSDVITANDDYFSTVKRGPEYDRREKVRREAASKKTSSSKVTPVVDVRSFIFGPLKQSNSLTTSLKNIFQDWSVWTREGTAALGAATRDELLELYESKESCIALMDWVFTDYYKVLDELIEEIDDHKRASKLIGIQKNTIARMEKELSELRGEQKEAV